MARAREAWKRGDRLFIVRQHEYSRLALAECKCDRNQCGGCMVLLANMGKLEKLVPSGALTDEQIEAAQAAARVKWYAERNAEASERGTVAKNTEEYLRKKSHSTKVDPRDA